MVRIGILLLILFAIVPVRLSAKEVKVCVIDGYKIAVTQRVKKSLERRIENGLNGFSLSNGFECDVSVLLGTPAVVDAMKKGQSKKYVYSFVLFPELLKLTKKKRFFGVRIFPLPEKTLRVFYRYTGFAKQKVAVPVSKRTLKVAKLYLPQSSFKIVPFKDKIEETFNELRNFTYIYIFPDPQVLRIVNLLNLIRFAKEHKQILISGLPDLKKYEINFIYSVDYDRLVDKLVELVKERNPKEKLLPCPARVEIWKH